ncbi:hypothetical protein RSOLAG1IB_07994 [Rhizoctonia solani AG-1 IB]|uniref:Uncharacterized protein n=1 Tax=Thanatephorus cucumeris (strain AG1-IB / isolate 7/3/14) TaxID=1108050 RepID=A0A0B7FKB9_THACB|nr:hypothetical protein RSOLAG1IB_07994 [Rhizoctonia solani AG-1 IB]
MEFNLLNLPFLFLIFCYASAGRSIVEDSGTQVFEKVITQSLPNYQMRVRQLNTSCDPTVKQFSGLHWTIAGNDCPLYFFHPILTIILSKPNFRCLTYDGSRNGHN